MRLSPRIGEVRVWRMVVLVFEDDDSGELGLMVNSSSARRRFD
jgi:putative AlgH/UPF0301 family transcriptional regulator